MSTRPQFHRQDSEKAWEQTRSPKLASIASEKEAAAVQSIIPPSRVHGFCSNFFADGEKGDIYSTKEILDSHAEFKKALAERVGGGEMVEEWGRSLSPSPFTVPRATMQEMADLQGVLSAGLAGVLRSWGKEDSWLQKALPLPPRAASVLLQCAEFIQGLPDTELPVGSFVPDVLIGEDGRLKVSGINAQFTLNGFLMTYGCATALHTMPSSTVVGSLALSAVPSTQSLMGEIAGRFDSNETLFVLVGREATRDLAVLEQMFNKHKGASLPPVCFVHPKQLQGGGPAGSLACMMDGNEVVVNQCILELHQDELLALSDSVLEGLLELSVASRCLNPIWTILLGNDKRMLGVLRTLTQQELPDKQARQFLKQHILPTAHLENIEALERLVTKEHGLVETTLVAKPCLYGKGEGIIAEKDFETPAEFVEAVSEAADEILKKAEPGDVFPYIVQGYFEQEKFNLVQPPSSDPSLTPVSWNVVATLLCLDDQFLGPGAFRSSQQGLVGSSNDDMMLVPATYLPTPPHVRYVGETAADVPMDKIKDTLLNDGIALVCFNEAVAKPEDFIKFIKDLGAVPHQHSKDVDAVWSIQPKNKGIARSHTADAFLPHTDASFEPVPPRFFALSVIRADQGAGGLLCHVAVPDAIAKLSAEDVHTLKTTMVRLRRPIEFQKDGMETTLAPVLFSDQRARIRGDIIMTDHLPEDEAKRFWAAYNTFYGHINEICHKSARLLPERSMILMDNHRFVHARTRIKDWRRSLLRIRFDIPNLPEHCWV